MICSTSFILNQHFQVLFHYSSLVTKIYYTRALKSFKNRIMPFLHGRNINKLNAAQTNFVNIPPKNCITNILPINCSTNIPPKNCSTNIPPRNCSTNIPPRNCSTNIPPRNCSTNIPPRNCSTLCVQRYRGSMGGTGCTTKHDSWWIVVFFHYLFSC